MGVVGRAQGPVGHSLEAIVVGEIDAVPLAGPEEGTRDGVVDDRRPPAQADFLGPLEARVLALAEQARDVVDHLADRYFPAGSSSILGSIRMNGTIRVSATKISASQRGRRGRRGRRRPTLRPRPAPAIEDPGHRDRQEPWHPDERFGQRRPAPDAKSPRKTNAPMPARWSPKSPPLKTTIGTSEPGTVGPRDQVRPAATGTQTRRKGISRR